jgi:hypothetical protein
MLNGERRRPTFEKRPRRGGVHGKHVFGHVIVEHVLCGEHADEQIARPVLEVTDAAFELANLRSSEGRRFVGMGYDDTRAVLKGQFESLGAFG